MLLMAVDGIHQAGDWLIKQGGAMFSTLHQTKKVWRK